MIFSTLPFLPPPAQPIDDKSEPGIIDDGQAILADALVATRLTRAFRQRSLDTEGRLRLLTRLVASGVSELGRLTQALVDGAMTLGRWFRSMWYGVASRDYAAGMADLLTDEPVPADLAAIRSEANGQVAFLERFRDGIQRGAQLLDGTTAARAGLYAHAAWGVGERVRLGAFIRNGFVEGIRMLGVADHCGECVAEADRGWVPIETVRPIGATICGARCHCTVEAR